MSDIIFLNGTSSAGKTTIAHALRAALPEPFCYYASDQLAEAGFRPRARGHKERERFFDGFHRSIAAFADADNQLLVEHIVESQAWADTLQQLLAGHAVFWVGVHAPIDELKRRELARGNRDVGEAEFHLRTHNFCRYDMTVDSTEPPAQIAAEVATRWSEWRAQRVLYNSPAT